MNEADEMAYDCVSDEALAAAASRITVLADGTIVPRSQCKPWCGAFVHDDRVPCGGEPAGMYPDRRANGGLVFDDRGHCFVWCSARCRELKLPPVPDLKTVPVAEDGPPPEVIRVCAGCLDPGMRHVHECPVRIQRAQLLEGGHSAALSAPARVLSPWVPSVSEWDLLPDA